MGSGWGGWDGERRGPVGGGGGGGGVEERGEWGGGVLRPGLVLSG